MYSSNPNHLPVRRPAEADLIDRPYSRHHSARYYAHRVKESLTTRVSKIICTLFLSLLFITGLVAFILWLSLKPHRPRFHIEDFEVSGLDQPDGYNSATISYNVTIRNADRKITVHYDSLYGAVFYRGDRIGGAPIETGPFDQVAKTTKSESGTLSGSQLTLNSEKWSEFMNDRTTAGKVVLKLEITSVIKFEIYSWDTKKHKMHASCDVAVGPNGMMLDSYRDKRCPVYFT